MNNQVSRIDIEGRLLCQSYYIFTPRKLIVIVYFTYICLVFHHLLDYDYLNPNIKL
jgi:hypothetical protein